MVKGSNVGSVPRKRLADISNMQQPSKLSNEVAKPQQTDSLAANVYVDQLHKENMTLMKLLAERKYPQWSLCFAFLCLHIKCCDFNAFFPLRVCPLILVGSKLIELNGTELQKMKINLQKAQQQNLQLAKANSSMLAELNSGKDRLRVLQHELGCINTLREARNFVLEDKANTLTCHTYGNQIGADKCDKGGQVDERNKKPCSDPSTVKMVQDKEKVDNKRLHLRRQSGRFKSEEAEPSEERLCLRRQSASFKCEEPAPELTQDKVDNKRLRLRRQSGRFKSEEAEPSEERLCLRRQSARFKCEEPAPELTQDKVDNKRFFSCKFYCLVQFQYLNHVSISKQSGRFKSEEAEPSEERFVMHVLLLLCLRRQSARFKCEEPAPEPTQDRRQFARFKSVASKPTEDSFEIDDVKSPVSLLSDKLVHENDPTSSDLSVQQEHKEGNCAQNDEAHETRRRSSGRPLRQAVEKVQSYKEIPLKVKMRREN
ncbi:hypothetical protein Pint_05962 [Pistacia integerrima]|uniref:Uncharacterized protein n=1 Tax=Pistacia integerrima TaxID=434235 RepID=A0ACC0Z3G8_9ROSI|nr:hypothetical protein Pint_05962 [Pistacia integerrima]